MANTRAGNVIRVDTSATFSDVRSISAVKYVGASSATAVLKKENTSGAQLWQHGGDVIVLDEVDIRCPSGIRVEVASGAVVYLYLNRK